MQKTNQNITLPTQFPLQENKQFEIHKSVAYVKVHTSFAQTEKGRSTDKIACYS